MDKAWKAECPIAHERPKEDEITDATQKIAAAAKPQPTALASLKTELERRRKLAAPKQQALQTAMGALTLARERHQKEREKLKAPAQEAAKIEVNNKKGFNYAKAQTRQSGSLGHRAGLHEHELRLRPGG
jgi:hypothetical protein